MNICMVVYNLVNNGIGKVVLTYSIELIRHGHRVAVLVGGPCEQKKLNEAIECGITVVQLPNKRSNPLGYFKGLGKALDEGRYDVCHIHGNSGMVFPELVVAKRSRVAVVACHCHNTGCEHPALHRLLRCFVPQVCDCRFACSEDAGRWLFGGADFTVLPNAFELGKFSFDGASRTRLRDYYGIEKKTFVLGNVARLNPEKNHAFLIDVFSAFHVKHPDSMLLIAGGGPGEEDVRSLINLSSVKDSILLLGNIADPSEIYSAMDCFVFPSTHEGLGIVLVEAQLAGLDCFVSSNVPNEACVSDRFHPISLSTPASDWASAIEAVAMCPNNRAEYDFRKEKLKQFDIRSSYHILEDAYAAALDQKERK